MSDPTCKIYTDHAGVYLRVQLPSERQPGHVCVAGAEHDPNPATRACRIARAEMLARVHGVGSEITEAAG